MVLFMLSGSSASSQTNGQIWTNLTYDWLATERLSYELDFEPKSQVIAAPGQPVWMNLDVTPNVSYAATGWMDLIGEVCTGYTSQSDKDNTLEVTPRVGVELHILSRILQAHRASRSGADREKLPRRRAVFANLVRLENRNMLHAGDAPSTSAWRFRDRLQFAYPFNRAKMTNDGVIYLKSDGEVFLPLDADDESRRVNQVRVRAGVGYRQSFAWRFEALFMWTATRNPGVSTFTTASRALDVRLNRVF